MRISLAVVTLSLSLVVGCLPYSVDDPQVDDRFVWVEKETRHEGVMIELGYRVTSDDGAQWLEPVAKLTRDGVPVANAMVFNSLVSSGGSDVIGQEVATVYETSPDSDAALYAQGKLQLPDGTSRCVVRFRIVLPGNDDAWTRDVTIEVK